jgi:hypothetical protein
LLQQTLKAAAAAEAARAKAQEIVDQIKAKFK